LLEDGEYQSDAFLPYPELLQKVTVYTFSDIAAPEEYPAATQAIMFTINPDKTSILQTASMVANLVKTDIEDTAISYRMMKDLKKI